ncbi:MAG: GNAT family N-acetyltransferase, partial [Candidatus Binatia bacterium]
MNIRKLESADAEILAAFLREIPEDDRTFFKEDLSDPETVRALTAERRGLRLVATDDAGRIAGYIRVLPGTGLSSHVGEIRLVIAPARRRAGLG